ncbi:hypothetical protein O181_010532 [Austropuccinia psidii MF-1]|uniref:Myb/SANT-like domain-containing protein n=1 Tax=Austropuccinia psidii MF-1 TaxID=1389203 RepID=A0A9Q3GLA4_9BASI|nr:hypothetical protein [Austropuccinia psidii MF-1]
MNPLLLPYNNDDDSTPPFNTPKQLHGTPNNKCSSQRRGTSHKWTKEHTTFFLEKYATFCDIGRNTDDENLKKEAWSLLVRYLNPFVKVFGGTYATGEFSETQPQDPIIDPIVVPTNTSYSKGSIFSEPDHQEPKQIIKWNLAKSNNFKTSSNPLQNSPRPSKKDTKIGTLIHSLITEPVESPHSPSRKYYPQISLRQAVSILTERYKGHLTTSEMIECIIILENERKTTIFLAICADVECTVD